MPDIGKLNDELARELAQVLNRNSIDTVCSTPDFILGNMLVDQLRAYAEAISNTKQWHGMKFSD